MKLSDKLESLNDTKRIKIRTKKLSKGFSLFLDYSKNYERQRLYTKLQISNSIHLTPKDKDILYKAEILRDKKEMCISHQNPHPVLMKVGERMNPHFR
jgi:hypothetical protein